MGGHLNVVIRLEDGSIEGRVAYTNATSFFFTHPDMRSSADAHFRHYLDPSRFDNDPELLSCSVAPSGYGLVVIDLPSRKIMYMQGYTSYSKIYMSALLVENFPNWSAWCNEKIDKEKHPELWKFYSFFKADAIKEVLLWDFQDEKYRSVSLQEFLGSDTSAGWTSFVDLLQEMIETRYTPQKKYRDEIETASFVVDTGFESFRFDESLEGSRAFREQVKSLGFAVDDKVWDEYDNECFLDEEE